MRTIQAGLLTLLVITGIFVGAQDPRLIDSLRIEIQNHPEVKNYWALAEMYSNNSVQDSSIALMQRALLINTNPDTEGKIRQVLGWLFMNKGWYSIASEQATKALELTLAAKDSGGIAASYSVLGNIAQLNELDSQAIELKRMAVTYRPLSGWQLLDLGYSTALNGNSYEAIGLFQKSLSLPWTEQGRLQCHYFLADEFIKIKQYDSAWYHLQKYREAVQKNPDFESEMHYYYWLEGKYFETQQQFLSAGKSLRNALAVPKSKGIHIVNDWNTLILPKVYDELIALASARHDKDSVIYFYEQKTLAIQDILQNTRKEAATFQLNSTDKQIKAFTEKEELKRRQSLEYILITVLLLTLAGVYFVAAGTTPGRKIAPYFSAFVLIMTFEFVLILLDPYLNVWSANNSFYVFLFNVLIAVVLIPLHKFMEKILKRFALVIQWKRME